MVSTNSSPAKFSWTPTKGLISTTFLLIILGILFVFEASVVESFTSFGTQYHFVTQHLYGISLGLVLLLAGYLLPPNFWIKLSPLWYFLGVLALAMVFIPGIGVELNGAKRWLSLAGFALQPVEFFKFGLITMLASILAKKQNISYLLLILALPVLLLFLQPDMGSAMLIIGLSFGLYFVAGGGLKSLSILILASLPIFASLIYFSAYRFRRFLTFLDPESDPLGASFHIRQITLALGRGGWFGQGIGNSQQKFSYIPEASTDSIFAIVAEEIGFIGSIIIIFLFTSYLFFGSKIVAQTTENQAVRLLALGIVLWISLQIILNLSAVVALIPLTGIPLPFFSYGRSAQVMILFATGILARIGTKP